MLNVLEKIGEILNKENITWAVGASLLLNYHGLIENPHDIDILIDLKDVEKVDKILCNLGKKLPKDNKKIYSTKFFSEYIILNVDIDVMGGLCINYSNKSYEYKFNKNSIVNYLNLNGVKIPLTSLEDWFILYQLIPNREIKVKIIEDYLIENGVKHKDFLERALSENLPINIKNRIKKLLSK